MTEMTYPPCPPEVCSRVQDKINQYCKDMGWSPGHPIIIVDPNGQYCYCKCGGGSKESGGETTEEAADD